MARILVRAAVLALCLTTGPAARAQFGPDEGGAVLKTPFDVVPSRPSTKTAPGYVESMMKQPSDPKGPSFVTSLPPYEPKPDLNRDIAVTPGLGPWMIMIQSYRGPEAATMARELAMELRNGASYRMKAFTFSYGEEERRKEYERVKALIEKQKEYLRQSGLPLDQNPIRVRTMRVDEQVAVLVGGYSSDDAARRALADIRKLPALDPKKVKLDRVTFTKYDQEEGKKNQGPKLGGKIEKLEEGFVNPFSGAFVCRNPSVKTERPSDWDKPDMTVLKRLNSVEPFSLLQCKKNITLVVKQFQTPTVVESSASSTGFFESIGLVKKKERDDAAATSAHNLCELLRKAKLESYVLHTKFQSIVTVGAFDGLEDPSLRSMQELLETRLQLPQVGLLPRPLPMQIPR